MPELPTNRASPCFVTRIRTVPSATLFLSKLLLGGGAISFGNAREDLVPQRIRSLDRTHTSSCLSSNFSAAHPYRAAMLITTSSASQAMQGFELELPSGSVGLARRLATTSWTEQTSAAFRRTHLRQSFVAACESFPERRESLPCHTDTIPTAGRSVGVPGSG